MHARRVSRRGPPTGRTAYRRGMALREYLVGEVADDYAAGSFAPGSDAPPRAARRRPHERRPTLLAACGGDDDDGEPTSRRAGRTHRGVTPRDRSESGRRTTPTTAGAPVTAEPVTLRLGSGNCRRHPRRRRTEGRGARRPREPRADPALLRPRRAGSRRRATAALCVDLLSSEGGTASLTDPAAAPAALGQHAEETLIGHLEAGIDQLQRRVPGAKIGVVGFCFGGGMTWNLMQVGDARIAAAVPFYGPAPGVTGLQQLEGRGARDLRGQRRPRQRDAGRGRSPRWSKAGLTSRGEDVRRRRPRVLQRHRPRYNEAAAAEAYALMLGWFQRFLT